MPQLVIAPGYVDLIASLTGAAKRESQASENLMALALKRRCLIDFPDLVRGMFWKPTSLH